MADNFGNRKYGRVYEGGKFYSQPAVDVPANAIYFPRPSNTKYFGVAEYPVKAGEKGAFAREGIFAFPKPSGWTPADGRMVYYVPSSQTEGTFFAASQTGATIVGTEIVVDGIPADQIWIDICQGR